MNLRCENKIIFACFMNLIIPADNKMYFLAMQLWTKVVEAGGVHSLHILSCHSQSTKLVQL